MNQVKIPNQESLVSRVDYSAAMQPQSKAVPSAQRKRATENSVAGGALLGDMPKRVRTDSAASSSVARTRNAEIAKVSDAESGDTRFKDKVRVETNIKSVEELRQTFDEFKANGKKTAVVSGGSVCGMALAIQLKKLGFNVIVNEKRPFYSRHNVLGLREESMYSLASLSEEGALLKHLVDNKYISINKANVTQEASGFKKNIYPGSRFMGWMLPHEKMKPTIPDRSRKYAKEQAQCLSLEHAGPEKTKEPAEELDLAWPDHEVVIPVEPKDWGYKDLTRIGPDNLATAKVMQLEKGLNEYCIARGIKFVHAETTVPEELENGAYRPTLLMEEGARTVPVTPDFPIDLICLAESASSKNAKVISLQTTIPTKESVYITNFSGSPTDSIAGFTGRVFDSEDTTIVLHASTKDEAVVNIGTRGKPNEEIARDELQKKLDKAKPIMAATGSNIGMERRDVTYESGRLDIALRRAMNPIYANMMTLGDGNAAGSPIGALGGSLALSAYPEMVRRLVMDPRFGSENAGEREALAKEIRLGMAQIGNVRLGLMGDLMRQLGFYSEKTQKQQLLQGVSSLFLLHDENRKGLIMDPRQPSRVWLAHPAGEAWLRQEFAKFEINANDEASKPPRNILEYMISGNYPPVAERTPHEVYWEHILLRHAGDEEKDIERNYSPDVEVSFVGAAEQALKDQGLGDAPLKGHDGVKTAANILNELMPATKDTIANTVVHPNDENGWVTEHWEYTDPSTKRQIHNGIDALLIESGQIRKKIIGYVAETAKDQADIAQDTIY